MATGAMLGSGATEWGANKAIETHNDNVDYKQARNASNNGTVPTTQKPVSAKDRLQSSREYAARKRQEHNRQQVVEKEWSQSEEIANHIASEIKANAERDKVKFGNSTHKIESLLCMK